MPDVSPQVTHDPAAGRFEIHTEQGMALLNYRHRGPDLDLVHTEVPQALEGHGYGAKLATSALDYARREGMSIIPTCPYVKAYIDRHPEYADLVARR
jgi:predicted GNAT family acetyltransferase